METAFRKSAHAELQCPDCDSQALYKYGRTKSGKQRFICIICGRQFTSDASRKEIKNKPECRDCGSHMHLYKRSSAWLIFRCSNYALCRTYTKKPVDHEMPAPR
jgi:DNA-directed RNA polymerase subunit RPC12/RpoP